MPVAPASMFLMKRSWPGHVHDAEAVVAEVEVGEADVDGDAAGLLFGQAVAVDAGEGLDERRLAVVDVAGGAEDQVLRIGCECRNDRAGILYGAICSYRPVS